MQRPHDRDCLDVERKRAEWYTFPLCNRKTDRPPRSPGANSLSLVVKRFVSFHPSDVNLWHMRFSQIDRITRIEVDTRLTAVKSVSLSEKYLEDHFPRFPVMPGVIMLESLFQASMWLARVADRFTHPMVALRRSRNVRFKDLVEPGDQLVVQTEMTPWNGSLAEFSASGAVDGRPAVSGKLTLERYWVHDVMDRTACNEKHLLNEFKRKFRLLLAPEVQLDVELQRARWGWPNLHRRAKLAGGFN